MSSTGQQPVRRRLVVRLVWHPLKALLYSVGGAVLVLLAGGIVYLDSRADLEPWHETVLQQEFTASSGDRSFADYLAREQRLFEEFGQGFQSMSPALRELEALLLAGKIAHGNHPVLTMCAANAVVQADPAGNRKLAKHKSRGRIDGMVSLAMATSVASAYETKPAPTYQMFFV